MDKKDYQELTSRKFMLLIGTILVLGIMMAFILRKTTGEFQKIHNSSFEKVFAVEELSVLTLEIQELMLENRKINTLESIETIKSQIQIKGKEIKSSLEILKSDSVNSEAIAEIIKLYDSWLLRWNSNLELGVPQINIEQNLIDLATINAKIGILEEVQYNASNESYHKILNQINLDILGLLILVVIACVSLVALSMRIRKESNRFVQEIEDKQLLYNQVVNTMPAPLILIEDETGQIIDVNPSAERIYQFTEAELKQMKNTDLSAEPDKTRAAVGGNIVDIPLRWHKRKNGEIFPVEIKASRFKWKEKNVHLAWIDDISNRMENEKKLMDAKLDAEMGERVKIAFLSNMTHEIRTPLNGLLGALQLIESMAVDEEQMELIKIGIESSESLLSILDNILDYSQMTSGKLLLSNKPFSLEKEVTELINAFESLAIIKGIEVKVNIEQNKFILYSGDRLRVRQIIMNLLSNAIKFTDIGQIMISLESLDQSQDLNRGVKICVKDTGCGIKEEDLIKIFDQFSQLDSSLTKAHPGAGLGLAIVKELVKQMNGNIEVKSIVHEGTLFSVMLPLMPYE